MSAPSSVKRIWQTSFQLRKLLIPRPLAWMSFQPSDHGDTESGDEELLLVSGFTSACYTPLTIMMADPTQRLLQNYKVTISLATSREKDALERSTSKTTPTDDEHTTSYTFQQLGLQPASSRTYNGISYPYAVDGSPIQLFGTVTTRDNDFVLITIATAVVDGSVLSAPTVAMVKDRSIITGTIDAKLVDAMADLGGRRFQATTEYRSMPRPTSSSSSSWTSTDFTEPLADRTPNSSTTEMTWTSAVDGRACSLGFNPTTAIVLSRPIGWISTYSTTGVAHLAPYSFFMDVGPDLVAFSAYSAKEKKDAQKDAEETGFFCYNMCTSDLAVPMNLSAAPLDREGSEFALAGLVPGKAKVVNAPVVTESPVRFECEYCRTVDDVGGFSIVIGRVVGVSVDSSVLKPDGTISLDKLRPITRLGYMDEYGVFLKHNPTLR